MDKLLEDRRPAPSDVEHEITHTWSDLAPELQKFILEAHCLTGAAQKAAMLRILLRIFNLANPKIIVGTSGQRHYFRVHEDSVGILKLLIKSYP